MTSPAPDALPSTYAGMDRVSPLLEACVTAKADDVVGAVRQVLEPR